MLHTANASAMDILRLVLVSKIKRTPGSEYTPAPALYAASHDHPGQSRMVSEHTPTPASYATSLNHTTHNRRGRSGDLKGSECTPTPSLRPLR